MREGDNNSIVPEHLSEKLIDSLCGENAVGEFVPDRRLSNVERYGISFRPRQTMFDDMWEARRVMTYVLNEILADIKLNSIYPNWDTNLEPSNVFESATWYEVRYIDQATNTKVRYDSSYKPIYNVSSISELESNLNVPDGTVLQVKGSTGDRAQLWIFDYESQSYKLIAIENAFDGIAVLNAQGEYIYMNNSHAQIFGYDTGTELIGKSWKCIYSD
jgi:PAS domain-containing protein